MVYVFQDIALYGVAIGSFHQNHYTEDNQKGSPCNSMVEDDGNMN